MEDGSGALLGEYLAVKRAAGLFDLSGRGKVLVCGEDRCAFLNSVLSADLASLPDDGWTHAALLEPKGHYLAALRVFNTPTGMLLDSPEGTDELVASRLNTYRFRSRVQIANLTRDLDLRSLQGPACYDIARKSGFAPAPAPVPPVTETWPGNPLRYTAHCSDIGTDGLWFWTRPEQSRDLAEALTAAGAVLCGAEALRILRIEAGEPAWGIDIDEGVIPMEAGQERALCFTKCYPGQEVVSRIHYRGHVNRMLRLLEVLSEQVPPRGAEIVSEGRVVGWITSAAQIPDGAGVRALGYVRREVVLSGPPVRITWEGHEEEAAIRPLPYRQDM